jgi:hypothetical protein
MSIRPVFVLCSLLALSLVAADIAVAKGGRGGGGGRMSSGSSNNKAAQRAQQQQQRQQNQEAQQAKPDTVTIEGTIQTATSKQLQVTDNKGKKWTILGHKGTKLTITGTANPEFLHPDLTLQFTASVDDKNAVKDKVGELTVVTASEENKPGIEAEAAAGDKAATRTAKITGKLTACHGKKLTVHAGAHTLQVELTDSPKINVSFSDGSVISHGDKVEVQGQAVQNKGVCTADDVKVTLAQPLNGTKKTKPKVDSKVAAAAKTKASDAAPEKSDQ